MERSKPVSGVVWIFLLSFPASSSPSHVSDVILNLSVAFMYWNKGAITLGLVSSINSHLFGSSLLLLLRSILLHAGGVYWASHQKVMDFLALTARWTP